MSVFTIYIDQNGEFRWHLVAENNQKIADSGEGYRSRKDCEDGIRLVKRMASKARIEAPPKKVEVLA